MPRPKEFDPDVALDQAMQVFWEKGYEATSMRDLVERTGVHRGSLYLTFGNKEEIYSAALEHYGHCEGGALAQALLGSPRPLAELRRFLQGKLGEYEEGKGLHGCMMANAAAEIGPGDERAFETATRMLAWREKVLCEAMIRAKEAGELPADADPEKVGRYLNVFLTGLAVIVRTRPPVRALKDAVEQGLGLLA